MNRITKIISQPKFVASARNFSSIMYKTNYNFERLKAEHVEVVAQRNVKHSATFIFFHGSGDSASNFREWISYLASGKPDYQHIKVVYPNAVLQPYTPLGGQLSRVWFDRKAIAPSASEDRRSLDAIYPDVIELINAEIRSGISVDRIVVGGFSMGGAMALHAAYHLFPKLAGVVTLASFLNEDSIVWETLQEAKLIDDVPKTPLRMFHGQPDTLVKLEWGRRSFDRLLGLGVKGDFVVSPHAEHEMLTHQWRDLQKWLLTVLPETDDDNDNTNNGVDHSAKSKTNLYKL